MKRKRKRGKKGKKGNYKLRETIKYSYNIWIYTVISIINIDESLLGGGISVDYIRKYIKLGNKYQEIITLNKEIIEKIGNVDRLKSKYKKNVFGVKKYLLKVM